jgi:hypothetical protein
MKRKRPKGAAMIKTKLSSSVVEVTPELAEEWLSHNLENNRNITEGRVDQLMRDMRDGEWIENGESIKRSDTNKLLDGQHRLTALLRVGVTLPMVVIEGLDERAITTIDLTKSRTAADMLKILGYGNTGMLAAATAFVWRYRQGTLKQHGGKGRPNARQVIDLLKSEPGIEDALYYGGRLRHELKTAPSPVSGVYYLINSLDPDDANFFWDKLLTGAELSMEDPIYKARDWFHKQVSTKRHGDRPSFTHQAAMVAKAWNHFRREEQPEEVRWRPGGTRNEPFPTLI